MPIISFWSPVNPPANSVDGDTVIDGSIQQIDIDPAFLATLITESGSNTFTNKVIESLTNSVHANSLHTKVHNQTGSTIYAGQPLRVTSWESGEEAERIALADNAISPANYLAEEDIAHGAYGAAIAAGVLTGLDTLGTGGGSNYTDDTGGWDEAVSYTHLTLPTKRIV